MAPDRSVGPPRRAHQAHRLPRNYQAGDPRRHRKTPHREHGSGQRPAGAPRARPAGRFRAVARAVEKGAAVALGRARAVGRRASARRARARNHRVQAVALLPRRGPVLRHGRHRKNALQSRASDPFRNGRGGRKFPPQLHRRRIHGIEMRGEAHRRSRPPPSSRKPAANWACPFRRPCPWHSTSTSRV